MTGGELTPGAKAGLAAALAVGMGAPSVAVYALSAVGPLIISDLHLTRSQFGFIAMVPFLVAIPASPIAGGVVDRLGPRRVLLALFALSCAAPILVSTAAALWVLGLGLALAGVALAISNPVTNQLVSIYLPGNGRGLVMGVKQSGVQMSQFLVGASLPPLAAAVGWQAAVATGALAVGLIALAAGRMLPPAPAAATRAGPAQRAQLPRAVWWLGAISFLVGMVSQAVNVYMPLYAFERFDMAAYLAGLLVGIIGGVGAVARITWGVLADRWGPPYLLVLISLGATVSLAVATVAAPALGAVAVWAGTAGFAATGAATNVVLMVALLHSVPETATGRASGNVAMAQFTGFATGPAAFATLVGVTGSYGASWSVVVAAAATATGLSVVWSIVLKRSGSATTARTRATRGLRA